MSYCLYLSLFPDPPRFTSSLAYSPVNVTEALFTVSATGTLPLSYSWYLNDTRLSPGSGLVRVLQGGTLVLVTFPSDGTTVRVEVSNIDRTNGTVNSISQSAVLFVRVINTGLTGACFRYVIRIGIKQG